MPRHGARLRRVRISGKPLYISSMIELAAGLRYYPEYLDPPARRSLLEDVRAAIAQAPLFTPCMPGSGKPFSVRMTNCGPLGWVSDAVGGYRYQARHPETGAPWPAIPDLARDAFHKAGHCPAEPEACLINHYAVTARMGLHQDRDEQALDAPVVSISLGDDCLFRFGGVTRGGRTQSLRLRSGDVLAIGGPSRLAFHGVDRIYPGTSQLLAEGGRFNLTLRRVTPL